MAPHDETDETGVEAERRTLEVSRRNFLKTIGVTSIAATVVSADLPLEAQRATPPPTEGLADSAGYMPIRQEVADNLLRRGIVGYGDHLSVQPGEHDQVHGQQRSAAISRRYRPADSRRRRTRKGPGIKEEVVNTPANRDYPGKHQDLPLGSYVAVPDHSALRLTRSFTVTAWIAPTTQRIGAGATVGAEGLHHQVDAGAGRLCGGHR